MSGNIHGMPVALLVQELSEYWEKLSGMEWLKEKWVNVSVFIIVNTHFCSNRYVRIVSYLIQITDSYKTRLVEYYDE